MDIYLSVFDLFHKVMYCLIFFVQIKTDNESNQQTEKTNRIKIMNILPINYCKEWL